jgi:hypothetical protein
MRHAIFAAFQIKGAGMSEEVFKAIIAAQDQTAATFEAIIARLQKVEHAAKGASHGAHQVTEHGGAYAEFSERVHDLGEHFEGLREHIGGVVEKAVELLPALGALGGAASLAGLFEMTEHAAEGFAEFNAQAVKLGISRTQLAGLQYAAQMTDVPVEKLTNGLARLSLTMGQVAGGKNKDAAALLAHLNIHLRDAQGHARNVADVLPQLAEAFKHTTDATMRSRMAAALFGARLGKDMLPLLREGRDGLEEFTDQAAKLRYAVTPEDAEGLEAYHRSMIGLSTAVAGFTTELSARLAPVLRPIVDQVTEWVVANRDWIATDIADHVKDLAGWVKSIDWGAVRQGVESAVREIHSLADEFGGVQKVAEAFLAFMAARWAVGIVKAIGEVSSALSVTLVGGFHAAEAAAEAFNERLNSFPAMRAVTVALAVSDKIHAGIPVTDLPADSPLRHLLPPAADLRPPAAPVATPDEHGQGAGWIDWLRQHLPSAGILNAGGLPDIDAPFAPMPMISSPSILTTPMAALAQPYAMPRIYQPDVAGGASQQPQQVELRVHFDNAPPGTAVTVTKAPDGPPPQIDVGQGMPGFGYGH